MCRLRSPPRKKIKERARAGSTRVARRKPLLAPFYPPAVQLIGPLQCASQKPGICKSHCNPTFSASSIRQQPQIPCLLLQLSSVQGQVTKQVDTHLLFAISSLVIFIHNNQESLNTTAFTNLCRIQDTGRRLSHSNSQSQAQSQQSSLAKLVMSTQVAASSPSSSSSPKSNPQNGEPASSLNPVIHGPDGLLPPPSAPPVLAHAFKSLSEFDGVASLRERHPQPAYDSPYARSISSTAPGSPRM